MYLKKRALNVLCVQAQQLRSADPLHQLHAGPVLRRDPSPPTPGKAFTLTLLWRRFNTVDR